MIGFGAFAVEPMLISKVGFESPGYEPGALAVNCDDAGIPYSEEEPDAKFVGIVWNASKELDEDRGHE